MNEAASELSFSELVDIMAGEAAAFRDRARLVPAGGPEDKVFPPTYAGGRYAMERRRIDGHEVETVLLDSVQSQANRLEEALLRAHDRGDIHLPLVSVDFGERFPHIGRITTLDAPHRIADAIFRESHLNGAWFRDTDEGKAFADASEADATALFELCPTALVFGVWDSTGPRGGLGAKFARALTSEIVGIDAITGVKTASRIDPLGIARGAGPIYQAPDGGWTLDESEAVKEKHSPKLYSRPKAGGGERQARGKPSELNLGNVTPDVVRDDRTGEVIGGGVTIDHALQTAVLSLGALRRLRFPLSGRPSEDADRAARVVLAAIGLAGLAGQRQAGYALRSRCVLVPEGPFELELIGAEAGTPARYSLPFAGASSLLAEAVVAAKEVGLPWCEDGIELAPSLRLLELVERSEGTGPDEDEPA